MGRSRTMIHCLWNHGFVALSAEGDKDLGALLEFSPGAAVWTWIAFLVALPLMWKFVYGPITSALEDRDRKVDDAIHAAEAARKQAEEQAAKAQEALAKAQAEARTMVQEAISRAERQGAEALAKAQADAKAQLDKAREEIAAEKRQALQEIRGVAVELTMAATGRLLQQRIDDSASRKLVEGFVAGSARETR
ncbi:MAG: hypothetical protein RL148_1635 [Planctomycetota bacterium]|jgi:F-type H+-transporting ATPase subunit b